MTKEAPLQSLAEVQEEEERSGASHLREYCFSTVEKVSNGEEEALISRLLRYFLDILRDENVLLPSDLTHSINAKSNCNTLSAWLQSGGENHIVLGSNTCNLPHRDRTAVQSNQFRFLRQAGELMVSGRHTPVPEDLAKCVSKGIIHVCKRAIPDLMEYLTIVGFFSLFF